MSPQRGSVNWVLCLEFLISFSQVGILGKASGEGFNRIFISSVLQVGTFRVTVFTDWSVTRQGSLVTALVWHCPPGFAAFLGLDLKHKRGLDVVSREVTFCIWQ